MTQLARTNSIIVERPKGSTHPHYPEVIYLLDYGYLENTMSPVGSGIDVWPGPLKTIPSVIGGEILTGILCMFDTLKHDAEIKFLSDAQKK